MKSLVWTIAPVGFCLFLPLLGCTGVGPHNWSHIEQPYHASKEAAQFRHSPMLADAQHEMPIEATPANRLLTRGRIREHWLRARGYEQTGETDQAAAHYQEILRLEPRYAPAHHRLGVLATMWGRFGDADQHFRLARMVNRPEPTQEEFYEAQTAASEKEAEERLAQEIAAEKRRAASLAREQGYTERGYAERGYTRHTLPAGEEGEMMEADEYYAQSERPLQQLRTAVRRRSSEWMAPLTSRVAGRADSMLESTPREEVRTARSRIVRDGERHYYPDEEEVYSDEEEMESDAGPQYRRVLREPHPAVRRTSVPVRSDKSHIDITRSTQIRTNILREEGTPPQYMAGAEERQPDAHAIRSEHAAATSGVRRRSADEADRFDEELPSHAMAKRHAEHVSARESLPEVWEAEARVEQPGTIVRTEATMTDQDQSIARKAAEIEAAIERNVQQKVSETLAERRIDLAREQLQRAQQQLVEAMLSAEQDDESNAKPANRQPAVSTEMEPAPRSRLPLPAPRRLRSHRTSAMETNEDLELAEIEAELLEVQEATERVSKRVLHQAAANTPATAGDADGYSEPSRVVQTSHVEEVAEPIEHRSMSELYEYTESTESAQAAKQIAESTLPMARAHQPERTVHSLDETTLHRREIQPRTSFQKKAPEAAEIMLYR